MVEAAVAAPARPALWRRIVVPLCVVLGCVLAATSVAATRVKLTALDTDTYVRSPTRNSSSPSTVS